jgi:hypothetical protein
MIRFCLMLTCLAVALTSIGCCGPMGCGPGCRVPMGCSDCDGVGAALPVIRPGDRIRNFKKRLMCGSGCGETYVGEWISTPPDACDPCCGDQWVGGAQPCRPFCWQPGQLLGNLYGSRFCGGAESSVDCGCDGVCDGGCMDGGIIDEGYIESSPPTTGSSSCGCASCNTGAASMRSAQRTPAVDPVTRAARPMNARGRYLVR